MIRAVSGGAILYRGMNFISRISTAIPIRIQYQLVCRNASTFSIA